MDTNSRGNNGMESSQLPTIKFGTHYHIECVRDGEIAWVEDTNNLIVLTGLEYILGSALGDTEKKDLFCGLLDEYAVKPEDTMEDHSFSEFKGYSSVKRSPTHFESAGVVAETVVYKAENVQFMIFEPAVLNGIFMTDNKEKEEDTGLLFGVAPFVDNKQVIIGDALIVTITVSAEG